MSQMATVFDDTSCELGEGPLWHPVRKSLFWFDILGQKLFEKSDTVFNSWDMNEIASAVGWVDETTLFMATESGFYRFDLETAEKTLIAALEADNSETRSNDGRADPWGGFWIGTMGKQAQEKAGAFYRFYKGEIRKIVGDITIPNACCFSKADNVAYYTDTVGKIVWKQALDPETGWPVGSREVFLDLQADELNPDGAVVDSEGRFWNAQWGASRVACYDKTGTFLGAVAVPTQQTSCPAFGGESFDTLYITTAYEHMDEATRTSEPAGQVFKARAVLADGTQVKGQAEPAVIL